MGSGVCSQVKVDIYLCCFDDHPEEKDFDFERNKLNPPGDKTDRQNGISPEQKTEQLGNEEIEVKSFFSERELKVDEIMLNGSILDRLNELRAMFQEANASKEIFLTIDKVWEEEVKLQGEDIRHFYTKLKDNKYERTGSDNRKCQILFRQHIPIFGKFFFEIEIEGSNPDKDSDFTIGLLDYLEGVKKTHSKGSNYEESFNYKMEKAVNPQERIKRSKTMLKLEIDRENSTITYYVNNQMKKENIESRLLKAANQATEMISLAPYIQTQSVGFVFSWKRTPLAKSSAYKMSTIIEEESSIRASH